MRLLPYRRLSIRTQVPPEVVLRRLQEDQRYEGEITADGFSIKRIIWYRNSFLPRVAGTVRADGTTAVLGEATLKLHPSVAVFSTFWLGGIGALGLRFLAQAVSRGRYSWFLFPPVGLFVFGYLLMQLAFLAEARPVRRLLEEITKAA